MIDVSLQTLQDIATELHKQYRCGVKFVHKDDTWKLVVMDVPSADIFTVHRFAQQLLRKYNMCCGCNVHNQTWFRIQVGYEEGVDVYSY